MMNTIDNNRLSPHRNADPEVGTRIHTYRCEDGIVRTRCTDHIPQRGPYAPIRHRAQLSSTRTDDRTRSCIACHYAQFDRTDEDA